MPEQISLDQSDGVLTITLDRPEQLNAFTGVMLQEMVAALDHADADDSVRAVIVTGRGRGFCAGADLAAGASTFDYDARGPATPEGHPPEPPVTAAASSPFACSSAPSRSSPRSTVRPSGSGSP